MKPRQYIYLLLAVTVLSLILWYQLPTSERNQPPAPEQTESTFNRNLRPLIYTKHARCRMGCRQIDAKEVEDILEKGSINFEKSEPRGKPDPKYALEGVTKDNQQVRIIFAASAKGMAVITC
jgi:hypothetical protein